LRVSIRPAETRGTPFADFEFLTQSEAKPQSQI